MTFFIKISLLSFFVLSLQVVTQIILKSCRLFRHANFFIVCTKHAWITMRKGFLYQTNVLANVKDEVFFECECIHSHYMMVETIIHLRCMDDFVILLIIWWFRINPFQTFLFVCLSWPGTLRCQQYLKYKD